jgi:hypothetical protein
MKDLKLIKFTLILVTALCFHSLAHGSSDKRYGYIKAQDTPGMQEVLTFPVNDLEFNLNDDSFYPKHHFISIYYKGSIIAQKNNPDFLNSEKLDHILGKIKLLKKNSPEARLTFIFGFSSSKGSKEFKKKVPSVVNILINNDIENNERLIERAE